MDKLDLVAQFANTDKEYYENHGRLSKWITMLLKLSEDVQALSADFEKRYEQITIDDSLPQELKEKLENRLDGIRLSIKSAGRLQRKLNVEPSGDEAESVYMSWEQFKAKLNREAANTAEKVDDEPTGDTLQPSRGVTLEQFAEVLNANKEVVEQIKSDIEAAEKKFVTFIEKSLALVMDGLCNGDNYARDLIKEVEASHWVQVAYVTEWLTVYTALMDIIKALLEKFEVGLLIPAKGEPFNEHEHEPLAVVEEPSMDNEQIMENVRYGYYFKGIIYQQERFIIRPAQVIIVKNIQGTGVKQDEENCESLLQRARNEDETVPGLVENDTVQKKGGDSTHEG